MLDILFLLLKFALAALLLAFGFVVWKHFKTMSRIKFYRDQNITVANGYDRFFVGNYSDIAKRTGLIKAGQQVKQSGLYVLDLVAERNGEDRFEGHRYPVLCFNFITEAKLYINDPDIVREIYTTFNHLTDKTRQVQFTRLQEG